MVIIMFLIAFGILGCSLKSLLWPWPDELIAEVEPFEPFTLTEDMIVIPTGFGCSELVVIDTKNDSVVRKLKVKDDLQNGYAPLVREENLTVAKGKIYISTGGHPYVAVKSITVVYPWEGKGRIIRLGENDVQNTIVAYDRADDKVIVFHSWGRFSIVNPNKDEFERFIDPGIKDYVHNIRGLDGKLYLSTVMDNFIYRLDSDRLTKIIEEMNGSAYEILPLEDGSIFASCIPGLPLAFYTNIGGTLSLKWATNVIISNKEVDIYSIDGLWNNYLVCIGVAKEVVNGITNSMNYVFLFDINSRSVANSLYKQSFPYPVIIKNDNIKNNKLYVNIGDKIEVYSLPDLSKIKEIEK